MNKELVYEILDKLKNGELAEHYVSKEDFLSFREHLVTRSDFKHFRGIAGRGGTVIYQYIKNARS